MPDSKTPLPSTGEREGVQEGDSEEIDSFLAELARADARPPPPLLAARATVGPYEIRGMLGRGGMGVVYRAVDARLGRDIALKILPGAIAADDRRKRFRREARSAAGAHHPNVATVFDVGEADGHVFLAMELVEGVTLRARLMAGPLALEEAARIAREIAIGLAHAHAKGSCIAISNPRTSCSRRGVA